MGHFSSALTSNTHIFTDENKAGVLANASPGIPCEQRNRLVDEICTPLHKKHYKLG